MQVAHAEDHVTHAVLAAGQARECGISDDPAFFQILSSTLYSDQKLAVVRETICNAWDAHIEGGCTHKAIEITLEDDQLTIRDFGPGIPDELMQPIYGVYGASTKKTNKNVTGGFGLGCKAPWSYTDHFEVTSFNGGTKTIYTMARSSAEVGGKPNILPIASFPTTESGLQVTIPILERDRHAFQTLINKVVLNGEIKATLNGTELHTLPFSKSELGYIVVPAHMMGGNKFNVRYGNVIYPLPHPSSDLRRFLEKIQGNDTMAIILQAPANSLSITPSRENLSITEMTTITLDKLMADVPARTKATLGNMVENKRRESIAKAVSDPIEAFDVDSHVLARFLPKKPEIVFTAEQMANRVFYYSIVGASRAGTDEILQRASILEKGGWGDLKLNRSFRYTLHAWSKAGSRYYTPHILYWLCTQLVNPMRDALAARSLNPNRIKVFYKTNWDGPVLSDIDEKLRLEPYEALPFLRRFVVLTYSKGDIERRLKNFPQIKDTHSRKGVFVYQVPRSFTRMTALREAMEAANMTVLDLTVAQPWERDDIVGVFKKAEKKKTNTGLPILDSIYCYKEHQFCVPEDMSVEVERTENPKYVFQMPRGRKLDSLSDYFDNRTSRILLRMFGKETGVVVTVTQKEAYLKKGAKDLTEHLQELVLTEYAKNKRIRKYLGRDPSRIHFYKADVKAFFESALENIALQKLLKTKSNMTERDLQVIAIEKELSAHRTRTDKFRLALAEITKDIPIDPEFEAFAQRIDRCEIVSSLDMAHLAYRLNHHNPDTARRASAVLTTILKG